MIINNESKKSAIVPIINTHALLSKRFVETLNGLYVVDSLIFQPKDSISSDMTIFVINSA
jgi:hypothetical protein